MKTESKDTHRKWEVIYDDEYITSIWKYDTKKNGNNPYEIEIKHKKDPIIEKKPVSKSRKKS